jgi:ATP-dependent Clp protease ATP-binding subunit ClpB
MRGARCFVDEGVAQLRTEMESMTEELEQLELRITRLEIEREAVSNEKDDAARSGRPKALEKEANLKSQRDALGAQWDAEKRTVDDVQKLRELELARTEIEKAQNYQKTAVRLRVIGV